MLTGAGLTTGSTVVCRGWMMIVLACKAAAVEAKDTAVISGLGWMEIFGPVWIGLLTGWAGFAGKCVYLNVKGWMGWGEQKSIYVSMYDFFLIPKFCEFDNSTLWWRKHPLYGLIIQKHETSRRMMVQTGPPCVAWVVLFVAFLCGREISEKSLDSEQTETGEGCSCGDRASSCMDKHQISRVTSSCTEYKQRANVCWDAEWSAMTTEKKNIS